MIPRDLLYIFVRLFCIYCRKLDYELLIRHFSLSSWIRAVRIGIYIKRRTAMRMHLRIQGSKCDRFSIHTSSFALPVSLLIKATHRLYVRILKKLIGRVLYSILNFIEGFLTIFSQRDCIKQKYVKGILLDWQARAYLRAKFNRVY